MHEQKTGASNLLENAKVAYQMFVFYWQALACFIIIFSDSISVPSWSQRIIKRHFLRRLLQIRRQHSCVASSFFFFSLPQIETSKKVESNPSLSKVKTRSLYLSLWLYQREEEEANWRHERSVESNENVKCYAYIKFKIQDVNLNNET